MGSSLHYYHVFHQVAANGSITKAAERLHMTQPSASYAIRQLEEQLGVQLLARKARGVELTEEGRLLFRFVEQAFRLLESGEQKLAEMKAYTAGIVRLGASDSFCKTIVLPFLESFRSRYPDIRIQLTHGKSEELLHRLDASDMDCALIHLPAPETAHIVARRPIQDCFVAGPAYSHLAHKPLPLREVVQLPFIMLSAESRTRAFLRGVLETHGLTLTPEIELGSIDLAIEFASRNMGVCYVNRAFVRNELQAGTIVELRTTETIPERSFGIVAREPSMSLAAELFVRELAEHISQLDSETSIQDSADHAADAF